MIFVIYTRNSVVYLKIVESEDNTVQTCYVEDDFLYPNDNVPTINLFPTYNKSAADDFENIVAKNLKNLHRR